MPRWLRFLLQCVIGTNACSPTCGPAARLLKRAAAHTLANRAIFQYYIRLEWYFSLRSRKVLAAFAGLGFESLPGAGYVSVGRHSGVTIIVSSRMR